MVRPSRFPLDLLVLPIVLLAATALWLLHADAWDLGRRSPILNYDTAQVALAGRELAWHGRLATPYALPIELVNQSRPPWPLAVVQPGMVLFEALVFRVVPARGATTGSDPRAWLTLMLPFCSFLMLGASLALGVRHLFVRTWPDAPAWARLGAALTIGLSFLLDPEAQHFAIGGFTELPFTLGLLFLLLGLAFGAPVVQPLFFGLVMGVTGLFRANMLGLAPAFALAAMWCAPPGRRLRVGALVTLGCALPLAPWWYYKWHVFGSPAWDLTRFVVWDGIDGFNWFSLYHQAALPVLPTGMHAAGLLAGKVLRNLPGLVVAMLLGPRGLWLGGLVGWLVLVRPARPLAAAGLVALFGAAVGVLGAAVSIPWLRYLFPTRILLEPVGLLALWSLTGWLAARAWPAADRRPLLVAAALVALAWGGWSTVRGLEEARMSSRERGVPSSQTLTAISIALSSRLDPGEPLMSNLGPALAWQTNHPVLHLALAPQDVDACRRRLAFSHVLLCFREPRNAWGEWSEVMAREGYANTLERPRVAHETRFRSADGFTIVLLQLEPLGPTMAAAVGAPGSN